MCLALKNKVSGEFNSFALGKNINNYSYSFKIL